MNLYAWYVYLDWPEQHRRFDKCGVNRARYDLPGKRNRAPNWLERLAVWACFAPRHGRLCWHVVHPGNSLSPDQAREVLRKWRREAAAWDVARYRK